MKDISDDTRSLLNDIRKQPGWDIFKELVQAEINMLRQQATQKQVELNERLWFSAEAEGYEECLRLLDLYCSK